MSVQTTSMLAPSTALPYVCAHGGQAGTPQQEGWSHPHGWGKAHTQGGLCQPRTPAPRAPPGEPTQPTVAPAQLTEAACDGMRGW